MGQKQFDLAPVMSRGNNSLTISLTNREDCLSLNTAIVSVATRITPLIFIPGISGSRLVDKSTGAEVWPAIKRNTMDKLLLNNLPQANIVATDAVRTVVGEGIFGVGDVYETLLDRLRFDGDYVEYDVDNDPARRTLGG
jgi:hypothetical protein